MEATKSSFLEVMGDSPMNRILDFLITFDEFDYSLTEIADNAGVGYSTLMLLWPKVEYAGLVICTRKVGKSKMFMLHKESDIVKELVKLHWQIARTEMARAVENKALEAA